MQVRSIEINCIQLFTQFRSIYVDSWAVESNRTKLVGLCHVSNVLGCVNPIERIAKKCHSLNAKLMVDACQSVLLPCFLAIFGAKDVVTWDVRGCQIRKQDCMIWPLIGLKPNSLEATCSCKFHRSFQHWPGSVLGVEFTCHRCLTCQLMFRAWEQTG